MAIVLTRVAGTVLTPKGQPVTGGSVWVRLSQAVRVLDGTEQVLVSRKEKYDIGADGSVVMDLAPNDTMSPSGVPYAVTFSVTTASGRVSWMEHWNVTSIPSVTDLGSVSRVDVPSQVIMVPGPKGDPGPAGASVVAPYTLVGTDPATTPLTVKGATAQAAILQAWRDAADALLTCVGGDGSLALTGVASGATALTIPLGSRFVLNGNSAGASYLWDNGNNLFSTGYASIVSGVGAGAFYGASIGPWPGGNPVNVTMTVKGRPVDSSTAIGVVLNTTALTIGGSKIASFQNNGVEKGFVDYNGNPTFNGGYLSVGSTGAGIVRASNIGPAASSTSLSINGRTSATAVVTNVFITSYQGLAIGSKIAAFCLNNATTEKFAVGSDGELILQTGTGGLLGDGTLFFDGTNLKFRTGGVTKTVTVA